MIYILELREKLRVVYQKFGTYLNLIFKFVFGLVVFLLLKNAFSNEITFLSTPVVLALALVTAFIPSGLFALVCAGVTIFSVYKMSSILALFILFIFLIMYFLMLRYTPKYGYVLVATPVLIHLGMPVFMPILLGILATPVTIVPVVGGSIIYYSLRAVGDVTKGQDAVNPDEALQIFKGVVDRFKSDKEMILVTVILAVILMMVYVLRRSKFNHSTEIATVTGVVVSMIIFVLSCVGMDLEMSIVGIIVFSLLSGAVAYVAYFMRTVLDYSAVEIVQFEDDDYYYYVKAVPKIKISAQLSEVKNISEDEDKDAGKESVDEEKEAEYASEDTDVTYEDEYDDFDVTIDTSDIDELTATTNIKDINYQNHDE